jgi:hypothetical protein
LIVRPATEADWPAIWPFFQEIVRAGETYAYPKDLDVDAARACGWSRRLARRWSA